MSNSCKSLSIILTTIIVILLVSYSTITGVSSSILSQERVNDIIQNNLIVNSVFASSDESGDDSNGAGDEEQGGSEETGDEEQGGSEETENITALNPSLTSLSASPQECPAGSPPGCFVIESTTGGQMTCPQGTTPIQNTPGGPRGTLCAPLPQPIN